MTINKDGIAAGRVVVITGAGRGIGRSHALAFAQEGAKVVVNDLGAKVDGGGGSSAEADSVVAEILALGGEAAANYDDISTWDGAQRLVQQAIDTFGGLNTVVNNAGILRDRMLVNMSFEEWDLVLKVHLNGTFLVTRHAAAYWRDQTKLGNKPDGRVISTSSSSGIYGNIGQANYGAAKAAVASFTIIAAEELARYGACVNAIAPFALTRMTGEATRARIDADADKSGFNEYDPANISPLVVWLGSAASHGVTGRVFNVRGGYINVAEGWCAGPEIHKAGRWEPSELSAVIPALVARAQPNADAYGKRATAQESSMAAGD